jgi:hypothetical protein
MADANSKPIPLTILPNGILVERGRLSTCYTGTREDLTTAGFASDDMFPALPKRLKEKRDW